jgi:uncharacterized protein (TIGR01777 family)
MRTLITGATGFIGRHLLPHFKRPVVLSRHGSKNRKVLNAYDLTAYDWSPGKAPPPGQAFDNVDVVIHLAGENVGTTRWTRAKRQRIYASRVTGTSNLVNTLVALPKPPRVLIAASAIGYYGSRGDEMLTESSEPGRDFLAELCVAWEAAALAAAEAGIRVVVLRIGLVLGPGGGALASMLGPFRLGLGGRLGTGQQWMSWIYVEDLVQLILFLLEHETIQGAVNATSPNPCRNADFTAALGKVVRRPTMFSVPTSMIRATLGQFADILLASQRVMPEVASRAGFEFRYAQLEPALAQAAE